MQHKTLLTLSILLIILMAVTPILLAVNASLIEHCRDGIKNHNESDIDCGGVCKTCRDNLYCRKDSDCLSGYCYMRLCRRPSCSDRIKNQNETGVDCGGICGGCADGMGCRENKDCISGYCSESVCRKLSENKTVVKEIKENKENNPEERIGLISHIGRYSHNGYALMLLIVALMIFYIVYKKKRHRNVVGKEKEIIDSIINEGLRN